MPLEITGLSCGQSVDIDAWNSWAQRNREVMGPLMAHLEMQREEQDAIQAAIERRVAFDARIEQKLAEAGYKESI